MRRVHFFYIAALFACVILFACNSKSGTKFKPTERTSSLSDSEREEKLAQIREELGGISIDTMFYSHGVKLSILPPAIAEDVSENVVERIAMKMLAITSQNGIGGIGTNPCFALAASLNEANRATTGTAPQKMMIEYDVTYYVINCLTGDVYGSASDKITGVGNTFAHAAQNAANEIKNTQELQQMLSSSSSAIIEWYNTNLPLLKSKVAQAEADNDFALALALLESVPSQSTTAYEWADSQSSSTLQKMLKQKASDYFVELKNAITQAGVSYSPDVAAYMKMIPSDSPEFSEAQKLYENYSKAVNDERIAELDYERKMELEQFVWEKEKTKLEMQASMKSMEVNASVEKTKAISNGIIGFCSGSAVGGLLTNILTRPIIAPFRFSRFLF